MSDGDEIDLEVDADSAPEPKHSSKRVWFKRIAWAIGLLLLPFVLLAVFLATPIGKRFVADQIAAAAPASGLRFEVGRIEGDLFGKAQISDLVVKDPEGVFLTIPEVTLDWRPLAWLWSGLDVREITARRGRLERIPELLPGDPDAPFLPDFDIRVDKLSIEDLVIAPGVATEDAQRVNLTGMADIRDGRALVDIDGRLGEEDRLTLKLDVEPDRDKFDLAMDYIAPAGGVIAGLTGLNYGYEGKIVGDGSWSRWLGHGVLTRWPAPDETANGESAPENVAAFRLTNRAGDYGLMGQINPGLGSDTILGRSLGKAVSLIAAGTFAESIFDGTIRAITDALDTKAVGAIDLADNRVGDLDFSAQLRDPDLFGENVRLERTQLSGVLDGAFDDLTFEHRLTVGELQTGIAQVFDINQGGLARYDGSTFTVPLDATVARLVTGNTLVDPSLVGGTLNGTLTYAGSELSTDPTRVVFPGLSATLALSGNTTAGAYAVAGPVDVSGFAVDDVGNVSGTAKLLAKFGTRIPWSVRANLAGRLTDVRNSTVANVAGETLRFRASLGLAGDKPIVLRDVVLNSERLNARFDSRIIPGSGGTRTTLAGTGDHVEYGDFTFDAELLGSGPRAVLVLADPYPAAGLKDVRVALAPSDNGFAIDVAGQSLLGEFDGALGLVLPGNAPTRINIENLTVYRTDVSGGLTLGENGLSGDLAIAGGGLNGTLSLAPASGRSQGFDVVLKASNARFGGATALSIANADIFAKGRFGDAANEVFADLSGSGLEYGGLKIANFAAKAAVEGDEGTVRGTIAGRRADRFSLKFDGDIKPDRIAVLARGTYGARRITMPRRAVLTPLKEGGYRLAKTQVGFARGYAIFEGVIGGSTTEIDAKLARMPLRLADLAGSELALGGRLSGDITYRQGASGPPTGKANIKIDNFTRSGLILSSQPIDVTAVIDLSSDRLTAAARLSDDGAKLGRIDARITNLGGGSDLYSRIMSGRLNAKLEYSGAAEALWRLAAIETFDLTGPLSVNARATGTLNKPRLGGTLSSDNLRLQSAISGTDISNISARGRFSGSRLQLTKFSGKPRGGGSVSGSGTIDLAGISDTRGPKLDLRAAVRNGRILNAAGLDATLTGPLRIKSNGIGGTIAGRVTVDRGSWELGVAAEDLSLPRIKTTYRQGSEGAVVRASNGNSGSWRYLVDAKSPGRLEVDGLGLDSEWAVDVQLRGTVNDPRLGGQARLVRGAYTFAGARFELTRGRINFNVNQPIDPRLDIAAEASRNGTDVTISITGRSQAPRIALSSQPALPDEEILAQLLFGSSVTSLSATDAVQLAAAIAALQGGSGLDPIGDLRRSIGLDQLRIVAADPTTGQSTGVALGKYLGNRVYVELVTDGQGYSATRLEYRVTSWLALLGTVSTIGRDSVLAEISRDY